MNPLEQLIQLLARQAGPRGYTFAGRAMKPGEGLQQALQRFPQGETEYGGMAIQATPLLAASLGPPMWLQKRLMVALNTRYLTKGAGDDIAAAVNWSVSKNPLNPIAALSTPTVSKILSMSHPLRTGCLTDPDKAAMVMHTLLNEDAHFQLARRLKPDKLRELKQWAHSVLQADLQPKGSQDSLLNILMGK